MADNVKMNNIKALFSESRSRTIIIFTIFIVLAGIVIGVYSLRSSILGPDSSAELERAPGTIRSIPGGFKVSEQYAKIQQQANVEAVKKAQQSLRSNFLH